MGSTIVAQSLNASGVPRSNENTMEPNTSTSILPPADIREILRHIPHRHPFLLIDRMLACEPGKWVRVVKNTTAGEWFFAGMPAARRAMPQVLVLEALAQAAGVLCHYSGMMSEIGKAIIFFAGIEDCRFGRDVVPGDQLVLECTLRRSLRGVAKLVEAQRSTVNRFSPRGCRRSLGRWTRHCPLPASSPNVTY